MCMKQNIGTSMTCPQMFGVGQLVLQGLKSAVAGSIESQGNYASLVYLRSRVLFQFDDYKKQSVLREDFENHFLQVSFIHVPKNLNTSVTRSSYMWPVLINVLLLRHLLCWSPHHRSWLGRSSNAQHSVIVGQGHGQEFGRREVWDMWNILKPFFGGWYNMVSGCVISWISLIFPIFPETFPQYQELNSPLNITAGLGLAMLGHSLATGQIAQRSHQQLGEWALLPLPHGSWQQVLSHDLWNRLLGAENEQFFFFEKIMIWSICSNSSLWSL